MKDRPQSGSRAAGRPVVEVAGVSLQFPGKDGGVIPVLDRVSLQVHAGEFVCIVGPSGCGKSTLLNAIAGFVEPTAGSVLVDGERVAGPDPRRIFVFQENGVFPWLNVVDNIGFGLLRRPRAERERIVAHYVEMVGLRGFERAYPRELSGGMRQRVEIARALAAGSDVIYMDEPFGALDFLTRLKMRADLMRIWREEKKTILFVTHDIEEAVQLADRVVVMSQRPATVQEVVHVPLPRPRDLDAPGYLATRDRIFAAMGMSHHIGEAGADEKVAAEPAAEAEARRDSDVVIVGGGPAGAILGCYLAKAGIATTIVERAVHPRPHVGESLLCSTTRVFEEIGVLPAMARAGFVRKPGATWTRWTDGASRSVRFRPMPRLGVQLDYTWHVDRSRLDELLLRHAADLGAAIVQGERATAVDVDGDRATGVRLADGRVLTAGLVVDASGRSTLIGTQLGLKRNDPAFDQFTVHNWFEGLDRGPSPAADHVHVHVLPKARSWLWQIPIDATTTSLGIVTRREGFPKAGEDPAEWFARQLAPYPGLASRVAAARPLHTFAREGNYSYSLERFAGDGWIAIGDAARFFDPLFSSGVSVAAESARLAAGSIVDALRSGDVRAERFADWERQVRRATDRWRELIASFYRLTPLFFDMLDRVDGRERLWPFLQGDVEDADVEPALQYIRDSIATVAADASHPWHGELVAVE